MMETRVHCAKISSGNSVCLYEMSFPKKEFVKKIADAAKQEGITAPLIFCEMVLENVLPEKCLFQYFVTEMTALS